MSKTVNFIHFQRASFDDDDLSNALPNFVMELFIVTLDIF